MPLIKTNQKPSSGFVERPVGLYEGKITKTEVNTSKSGSSYWTITFEGKHQKGVDAKLYLRFFPESGSDYCQRAIMEFFTCLGVWDAAQGTDTLASLSDIEGSPLNVIARFEEDQYNGAIKKRLRANTILASDFRTAFEISEGAEKAEQYAKDILWVEENPIKKLKQDDEEAF